MPVRRHVDSRLVFNGDVFQVPCIKEKPIMIVEDFIKPVPVDCHVKIREKDVTVLPVNPGDLNQCDIHAMWMRTNADLLSKYLDEHDGLYPRGYHGPEATKVQLKPSDWETVLLAQEQQRFEEDGSDIQPKEDLGPLPLHPGHPLMMTVLQNQWLHNPTNMTHGMYNAEFFNHLYPALNAQLDPKDHLIHLTEEQQVRLGGQPAHISLPSPWKLVNNLNKIPDEES